MESRTHTDTLLFRGADLSLASNKHHRSNGKSNGATVFSEWLADLKLPGESPIGSQYYHQCYGAQEHAITYWLVPYEVQMRLALWPPFASPKGLGQSPGSGPSFGRAPPLFSSPPFLFSLFLPSSHSHTFIPTPPLWYPSSFVPFGASPSIHSFIPQQVTASLFQLLPCCPFFLFFNLVCRFPPNHHPRRQSVLDSTVNSRRLSTDSVLYIVRRRIAHRLFSLRPTSSHSFLPTGTIVSTRYLGSLPKRELTETSRKSWYPSTCKFEEAESFDINLYRTFVS